MNQDIFLNYLFLLNLNKNSVCPIKRNRLHKRFRFGVRQFTPEKVCFLWKT